MLARPGGLAWEESVFYFLSSFFYNFYPLFSLFAYTHIPIPRMHGCFDREDKTTDDKGKWQTVIDV